MFSKKGFTKLTILLFNLAPIIGVAFYDWSPFEMFWLFWMETLILSFFDTIRVLTSQQQSIAEAIVKHPIHFNIKTSFRFFLSRLLIFIFYSIFIIGFIGFIAQKEKDPALIWSTLTFQNLFFNLALSVIFFINAIYLVKYFFSNGAYLYSKSDDYPMIFDGRQVVMHIGVVVGTLGSVFLFKESSNTNLASVWVISIFCFVKCISELYFTKNQQVQQVSAPAF